MRAMLGLVLGLIAGNALAGTQCKFTADRNLDVSPAGLHALAFELGSSDLRVQGVPGLGKIEVHGKACASEESRLAELTLDQSRQGDRVTITPHQANEQTFGLFGSSYAYIDLEVRVPENLAIEVKTRSGDADISDIAALDFSAHSGDLILHRVSGDVAVEVHSGDVNADDVGSLTVRHAGSGDIRARTVRGDVKVGNVGSGDLGFTDIGNGVHVDSVGSGDIIVTRAKGDVTVGSIGSGDVTVNGVGGDFTVRSAGSGDIHHHDVKGRIDVPKRYDD
jgi:DUF4097 and DUF4098 domain-containing protein YvlB